MTLREALGLKPEEKMLSLIGAGGKTTTLFCLGHELYEQGQKVLVTTTTKIFKPTKPHIHKLYLVENPAALIETLAAIKEPSVVAAGREFDDAGKLAGLPSGWFETLKRKGEIDWILVEADGAASLHFKVPAEHEPVVPDGCDVTIWVMSVKILGQPLAPDWVHRAEKGAALLGVEVGIAVTQNIILRLAEHPQGCLKGIPPKSRKIALINQADSPEEVERARELGHELVRHGFERAVITSYLDREPVKAVLTAESCFMISGIVLAAGAAQRMGRQKLLFDLKSKPVLQWVLEGMLASNLDKVVCVVRDLETIREKIPIEHAKLRWTVNERAREGQSTSVIAGLKAVSPKSDGALFCVGDQPLMQSDLIDKLIELFVKTGAPIVAPIFKGQTRNPVLFRRGLFPELLALTGDTGARGLVKKYRDKSAFLDWKDESPFLDLDVWEDYEKLSRLDFGKERI